MKAKTWLWIALGFIGLCVFGLMALAGAGVYFVSQHVNAKSSTSADARDAFESARAAFGKEQPLIDVDSFNRAHPARRLEDVPTSDVKPQDLWVLAWNPDDGRLVKVSLPFWILKLGHHKVNLMSPDSDVDLDRLHIDVNDLERIGPALVVDYRAPNGERVLVWTR